MQLQLQYNNHNRLPVAAAFIRGDNVTVWLKEISLWNVLPPDICCYIVPASLQLEKAAGLLIVFGPSVKTGQLNLLEPFSCVGEKLYIPVDTGLLPAVSSRELKKMLLWDKQMLHPAFGFVGFEQTDQLALPDLFVYNNELLKDWSFAHPGLDEKPMLQQILIEQPSPEELIESIKNEIGQKPLNEMPTKPEDETSAFDKLLDTIKFGALGGLLSISSLIDKVIPVGPAADGPEGAGIFKKLQQWLQKNIEELEARRNDEIQRLLKLFDENNEEALQYAIPLYSPYMNRGTAEQSDKLVRRSLNFNLGKLGGGQAVDGWNLGNHYNDLRSKYMEAAKKAILREDFKKAAYVYAHLLGDYHSAANTLEQGNYYREAAMLYKEHLKNIIAAAECLERGGLYNEAIDLYKELERNEKVGDIYSNLQKNDNAAIYYEKHVAVKYESNDFMDAGRVVKEKLQQDERAKAIFLEGWQSTYQAEPCLKSYFDIILENENDNTEKVVKDVYHMHTAQHKKLPFLNVLEYINKRKKDESLTAATKEIVYEIVHGETEEGNLAALANLHRFFPSDKLLSSDSSRYIARNRKGQKPLSELKVFHLDQSIRWIKAVWHRNQFIAMGKKNNLLQMVRANWYGNTEYYTWSGTVTDATILTFINAPYYSNRILLHCSNTTAGVSITKKTLPKNKYFTEALTVECPSWMQGSTAQLVINEEQQICRLDVSNTSASLHQYSPEGELKSSINCVFENGAKLLSNVNSHPLMVYHDGYFYTYKDMAVFSISKRGVTNMFGLNSIIRFIAASQSGTDFYLVVSTNKGCALYKPVKGKLSAPQSFFAVDLFPSIITFISATRFVIAEKKTASVFEIDTDDIVSKPIGKYQTDGIIISVFPGTERNQFLMLEESGRLGVYNINGE